MDFTRRQVVTLAGLAALIPFSTKGFADEGALKSFMKAAVADLDLQKQQQQADALKISQEGKAAPLFVRIPGVRPFLDWDFYYLDAELQWVSSENASLPPVTVPKGFVTDLASIPSIFWSAYPPTGRYAYAAIVHDYLYWEQSTSRDVADEILAEAMRDAGTGKITTAGFRGALALAGGFAWDENRKRRDAGERRVLQQFPTNPLISWEDWRKEPDVFAEY